MLKVNTEYYKINFQINEGGKYFTLSYMLFQPDYGNMAIYKGMFRVYLFGKVFIHWIKK